MNAQQQKRLGTLKKIAYVFRERKNEIGYLPDYAEILSELDSITEELEDHAHDQQYGKRGRTADRNQDRDKLIKHILMVANCIAAWASYKKDIVLTKKAKVNDSELERSSQATLLLIARNTYKLGLELINELAAYRLKEADLEALAECFNKYDRSVKQPAAGDSDTQYYTSRIRALFRESAALLKRADYMIDALRFSEPEIYANYWITRTWVKAGYRKVAVKGRATDALTGEGLPGAEFRFRFVKPPHPDMPKPRKKEVILATSRLGGFMAKRLAEGTWECTVRYRNHVSQKLEVYVNPGEMTRLMVRLEPKAA